MWIFPNKFPPVKRGELWGEKKILEFLHGVVVDCGGLCKVRCSLHSRPSLCTRACGTCYFRCKCVPLGTAGNRQMMWKVLYRHDHSRQQDQVPLSSRPWKVYLCRRFSSTRKLNQSFSLWAKNAVKFQFACVLCSQLSLKWMKTFPSWCVSLFLSWWWNELVLVPHWFPLTWSCWLGGKLLEGHVIGWH